MSAYVHPQNRAAAAVREALIARDKARQAEGDALAEARRLSREWSELPRDDADYSDAYRRADLAAEALHEARQAARQAEQDYLGARIEADVHTETPTPTRPTGCPGAQS